MSTHGEQARNESYESEHPVASGKRAVVLAFVKARGAIGATREEIAAETLLSLSSVCGRVNELENAGSLITTSMRRIGSSGKSNSVVCASEFLSNGVQQEGRAASAGQAQAVASPGHSGQRTEHTAGSGKAQGQLRDGATHPLTSQLAALAEKRAAAEQQLNLF